MYSSTSVSPDSSQMSEALGLCRDFTASASMLPQQSASLGEKCMVSDS